MVKDPWTKKYPHTARIVIILEAYIIIFLLANLIKRI